MFITSTLNTPAVASFKNHLHIILVAGLLSFPFLLAGCGGGSDDGDNYAAVETHLGYENEASATRINYPKYIEANSLDWNLLHNEEFRQLGELVEMWDRARRGAISLPETRNVQMQGADQSVFERKIRIIRSDWDGVGKNCGYNSRGEPNNGCARYGDLPKCSIYVPHQEIYAGGDVDDYHTLLGHEMWHCLVGSFH